MDPLNKSDESDELDELNGFAFEIEFNECNLNRFNFNKKIKPLMDKFQKINYSDEMKNLIIDKIKLKMETELIDEKDLLSIYNTKITKLIKRLKENLTEEEINKKIKETIETPLEGEIAKHNKIKVITVKLIKKDTLDLLDVMFYVKYKQIEGYNKQIKKLYESFL